MESINWEADLLGFSLPAPASNSAEFVQWPLHLRSVFGRIDSWPCIPFNACRSLIYKRWNIKSIQKLIATLFFVLANVDRMTGSSRRCLRRIATHHDSADCRRRVERFRLIFLKSHCAAARLHSRKVALIPIMQVLACLQQKPRATAPPEFARHHDSG